MSTYPHIRVSGNAFERGQQIGEKALDRVKRSVEIYKEIFMHYVGWDWERVVRHAARFRPKIELYDPKYLREMEGIAKGAALDPDDILAINVRTEIMFSAMASHAAQECTAFVALPEVSRDGRLMIGQSWDWKPQMMETVIVLEAEQEGGPNFVTVVEAGLLAKTGFNSAGIGLVTNALTSNHDIGDPGVPFHVVLRAILDAETMSDALGAILRLPRSSSANYLIAHRDGLALNAETAPGDFSRVYLHYPENGIFVHTNHFISPKFDLKDVTLWDVTDSPFRRQRMEHLLRAQAGRLSAEDAMVFFADHVNHPSGICSHPDPRLEPANQYATVAAVIMDLAMNKLWIADGLPCENTFRLLDYSDFMNKPLSFA